MNWSKFSIFFFVTISFSCNENKVLLPNFDSETKKVVFFLETECPICQKYRGNFNQYIENSDNKTFFYFIFPNNQKHINILNFMHIDSLSRDLKKCLIMPDKYSLISKEMKATTTPEVMIFNSENKLVYQGKIDDQFESLGSRKPKTVDFVSKTLTLLSENENLPFEKTLPVGCLIEF